VINKGVNKMAQKVRKTLDEKLQDKKDKYNQILDKEKEIQEEKVLLEKEIKEIQNQIDLNNYSKLKVKFNKEDDINKLLKAIEEGNISAITNIMQKSNNSESLV